MESKRTSIRIPLALWTWLVARAAREGRTLSNLVIRLLEQERQREVEGGGTK